MPYGSELYQLLTSFDPYGAYKKGQAAPQEAAIEQQKRDVEQQKLSVQQKQLKELAGEKPAQEAPELAQMAQNPLGNDYTIKDAEGNSTFAAQAIPFVSKSAEIKKQIAKNQQDIKMATAFGDNNLAANLSQEGRRLIDDLTRSEAKIQDMKQQGSDSIISNVSLGAKDQKSYENVVKSTMDKLGLVKRPNWLPETWTPDLKDQIRGYASDKTATAIDNALDRRESEKRAVEREKDRKTNQIAKERDDPLHYALLVKALNKGVGGEGGGATVTYGTLQEKLDDPKYGVAQGKRPAKEQTIARRITTDAAEVTQGIDQVMTLTEGGMRNVTGTTFANVKDNGFLSATGKAFTNTISNKESQMYDAMIYPLVKGISLYANPDYRPTDNDVKIAMQSYKATSGQPHIIQLEKLAELKKNFNAASESFLDSYILNAQQATSIKKQIKEVNKAIPWDVNDVVKFTRQKDYKKFDDYLKKTPSKETSTETKKTGVDANNPLLTK